MKFTGSCPICGYQMPADETKKDFIKCYRCGNHFIIYKKDIVLNKAMPGWLENVIDYFTVEFIMSFTKYEIDGLVHKRLKNMVKTFCEIVGVGE